MDERLNGGESRRKPVPWHPAEAIPVVLLSFLGTGLVAALVPPRLAVLVGALVFMVLLAGLTIVWISIRYPNGLAAMRVHGPRPVREALRGVAWGIGLYGVTVFVAARLVVFIVSLFTSGPVEPPEQPVLPDDPETLHVVLGAVAVVVAAPIGEELFFRGFVFAGLRSRLRFWVAAIVSALVFALFHVIPLLIPLMFVVGVGLAYLYEHENSLISAMAAHAAFNAIGYTFVVLAL